MTSLKPSGGYGHSIRRLGYDWWEMYWAYDVKPAGCRYRYTRCMHRHTDDAGALRFCKKWGLAIPAELLG